MATQASPMPVVRVIRCVHPAGQVARGDEVLSVAVAVIFRRRSLEINQVKHLINCVPSARNFHKANRPLFEVYGLPGSAQN